MREGGREGGRGERERERERQRQRAKKVVATEPSFTRTSEKRVSPTFPERVQLYSLDDVQIHPAAC